MKQYKACAPEQTIERIRELLAGEGLFLKEWNFSHGEDLFNCHLSFVNDSLEPMNIGNNGKGRSYLYALASGYAEILERLQNGIHFDLVCHHRELRYLSAVLRATELGSQTDDWLARFDRLPSKHLDEVTAEFGDDLSQLFPNVEDYEDFFGRYYDVQKIPVSSMISLTDGRRADFPLALARIATASSGMCAGNTSGEALLHGFCEIFERYAAQRIMRERITPPTIPTDHFKGTGPWHTIQRLEKRGLRVTVKDCSLGLGLPVVGVLIVNPESGHYNFKLGAEFVAEYALERCLTEVYQCSTAEFKGVSISHFDKEKTKDEWHKAVKCGGGAWPDSIFADKPTLPPWFFPDNYGRDDLNDLARCRDICVRLGSNVYVRDNSFLGFPSYHIIVPGMSRILYDFEDIPEEIFYDRQQTAPFLFADGAPCAEKLIEVIEPRAAYAIEKGAEFDLCKAIPAYANEELSSITPRVFLCLAACHKGDMDEAYRQICEQCRDEKASTRFHHALADWIALAREGTAQQTAISILTCKYGQGVALKAAFWLAKPEAALQNSGLLYHFNPQNWEKSKSSHLAAYEKISAKLAQRAAAYQPDYDALAKIFIKE